MDTVLTASNLCFAYPDQPPLLAGWSAEIGLGVGLIFGDTGSGKSTLLRLLAGELAPTGGTLALAGAGLATDPAGYRAHVTWYDPATAEFDQIPVRALSASLDADPGAWAAHAEGFALGPHLDKPLYMLSTGSRRKVWLAAALASRRPLTLLDEPTSALDAPSVGHLKRALAALAARRDRTILLASAERHGDIPFSAVIELPPHGA